MENNDGQLLTKMQKQAKRMRSEEMTALHNTPGYTQSL